jgi:hypothetical protein
VPRASTVATGEVRPSLLGHHDGDVIAEADRLLVATKDYKLLVQIRVL